jgi:Cyclin, N-terminal domain
MTMTFPTQCIRWASHLFPLRAFILTNNLVLTPTTTPPALTIAMAASTDTIETIHVMLRQETEYSVTSLAYPLEANGHNVTIDAVARGKMVHWCCQVVHFCRLEIETVSIAMNYADRMCVQDPAILTDPARYKLVVMTALYTAAKIHASEALGPTLVSHLSSESYSAKDIEQQERELMAALQWRLNPPTAQAFVHQFMVLYGPVLTPHEQHAVTQCAMQQLDEYCCQFQCGTKVQGSVLACCAVMNAVEHLPTSTQNEKRLAMMGYNLARLLGIDPTLDYSMISGAKFVLLSQYPSLQVVPRQLAERKRLLICEPEVESTIARCH